MNHLYVECEWGPTGLERLAPECQALVILDVLSFSTSVDIAVSRGARVYPYRYRDASAAGFADRQGALLAGKPGAGGYSLSPSSLLEIPAETRLVLPSPNGGALSAAAGPVPAFTACLRNAAAVAEAAVGFLTAPRLGKDPAWGPRLAVIPAGERWPDGGLRPALEDWLGAGALIHALPGRRSPEAAAAEAAFLHFKDDLLAALWECPSGRELVERGRPEDLSLAASLNASRCAPFLQDGAFLPFR